MPDLQKYSVGTIVGRAFRKSGIFSPDEKIPDEDQLNGLRLFVEMIDSWAMDNLTVYGTHPRVFKLEQGKKQYTYGPGGDWDSPRPIKIEAQGVTRYGDRSIMTEVLNYSVNNWAYENYWRDHESIYNPVVWVEQGYPALRIHTGGGGDYLTLFVKEAITSESGGGIDDIDAVPVSEIGVDLVEGLAMNLNKRFAVELPPGYIVTMIHTLAVDMVLEYPIARGGLEGSLLINRAQELYDNLRRANWHPERCADPRAPIPTIIHAATEGPIVDPKDPKTDDGCKPLQWNSVDILFDGQEICFGNGNGYENENI